MKTKNIFIAFLIFLFNTIVAQQQIWEQTNGPYGGNIQGLAIHYSGDLYAGVSDGGLFRSTNGGDSWSCIGFTGKSIDQVFIPSSGCIFISVKHHYVDSSGNNCVGHLPYRSVDSGVTWQELNIYGPTISCWAEDNSGNIYAVFWPHIFKSNNQGETWVIWSHHYLAGPNDFLFFDSYIFMSDDSNGIFRLINNYWVKVFPSQMGGLGTSCIERTNSGILLAGTQIPGQGVYRSLDNATNWQRVFSAGIENTTVSSIVINSVGTVFAGTDNGVFKSTDEGATWSQLGLQNSWVWTLALTATDKLIAGNSFGIYRWSDSGNLWEEVNSGLYVNTTFSLAKSKLTDAFFALTNVGLFRFDNTGNIWESVLPGAFQQYDHPSIHNVALLVDNYSNQLFTSNGWQIYRSSDEGNTWIISVLPSQFFIMCFESGLEPGVIYGGGIGSPDWWRYSTFFYSSNYGITWSQTLFGDVEGPPVQCIARSATSGYLFTGTSGSGLYRSIDQGLNWRKFNIGLTNSVIQSTVINSDGHIFLGTFGGVFRSRDEGGNWRLVGLENDTVLALEINSIDYLLAGTKSGHIYMSTNDGDTWNDYSDGLGITQIRSLVIDENGFAMAGTVSEGVFRTIVSTVDIGEGNSEVPTEFLLSQNYPNPFNSSSAIEYSIPKSSQVTLKIFNALGEEISTLVKEEKAVGTYEVNWNAANLPSGVYFYRLQAGSFVETKKMILLK